MQPEPSVHDNNIYAYVVDCLGQRLILHTSFRDVEPHQFTDIVFQGVIAHHFWHVLAGNILFDVEETDIAELVSANADLLSNSYRYGWPPIEYDGDLDALVQMLRVIQVRGFTISSSYGMSGWLLATGCDRIARAEPARIILPE